MRGAGDCKVIAPSGADRVEEPGGQHHLREEDENDEQEQQETLRPFEARLQSRDGLRARQIGNRRFFPRGERQRLRFRHLPGSNLVRKEETLPNGLACR